MMAAYDTPGVALGVQANASQIFVADSYAGLLVLAQADFPIARSLAAYAANPYSHAACHTNFAASNSSNPSSLRH
ncbi:MAG: hypothetical protein R2911_05400 [Caldilineaceae bacterium]